MLSSLDYWATARKEHFIRTTLSVLCVSLWTKVPQWMPLASSMGVMFWQHYIQPQQWVHSSGYRQKAGDMGWRAGSLVTSSKGIPAPAEIPKVHQAECFLLANTPGRVPRKYWQTPPPMDAHPSWTGGRGLAFCPHASLPYPQSSKHSPPPRAVQ